MWIQAGWLDGWVVQVCGYRLCGYRLVGWVGGACMYTCAGSYVCICAYLFLYVQMLAHTHIELAHTHTHACTHTCSHTHMYAYACMHAHTHTHTHTQKRTSELLDRIQPSFVPLLCLQGLLSVLGRGPRRHWHSFKKPVGEKSANQEQNAAYTSVLKQTVIIDSKQGVTVITGSKQDVKTTAKQHTV